MANNAIKVQIEFIKNCLRKGDKRVAILSKYGKKWQKASTRTFDRRLKLAEKEMEAEQKRIQIGAEQKVAEEIDARKIEIMDAIERKAILTQIARGQIPLTKPMVVGKVIEHIDVVPDYSDRRAAIAELNKMDGDYAPIKNANTDPDGNYVPNVNIHIVSSVPEIKESE